MKLIEAITTIRNAIDVSTAAKTDGAWGVAVETAGLTTQGNTDTSGGIDETYSGTFGLIELRVNHTWRDTSKAFSTGPDRTRVSLEVILNGKVLDAYTNGYES